jgi:hypothetical protein
MRALIATVTILFALAQQMPGRQKDRAFQASSPKTFKASLSGLALFLRFSVAWIKSGVETGILVVRFLVFREPASYLAR